jgi:hypothetical protein
MSDNIENYILQDEIRSLRAQLQNFNISYDTFKEEIDKIQYFKNKVEKQCSIISDVFGSDDNIFELFSEILELSVVLIEKKYKDTNELIYEWIYNYNFGETHMHYEYTTKKGKIKHKSIKNNKQFVKYFIEKNGKSFKI